MRSPLSVPPGSLKHTRYSLIVKPCNRRTVYPFLFLLTGYNKQVYRLPTSADRRWNALIGKRLAQLRDEAGLSQEILGVRAGIHGVHVNRIENGRVRSPGVATLQALADVLSEVLGRPITVTDLLDDEPEPAEAVGQ